MSSWSSSDWLAALTGELGEAANIVKKLNRVRDGIPGNTNTPEQLKEMLAHELADVAIYLDLFCQSLGFDLETIREEKFAITNKKLGYTEQELRMSHHCHATGCTVEVPQMMFMCKRHWYMVPHIMRTRIWNTYRPGQCDDMKISHEYAEAAKEAVIYIARMEGRVPDTQLYDVLDPKRYEEQER
jgi:NTP pyrophosphatase (non-canonical NTP hydrolase)